MRKTIALYTHFTGLALFWSCGPAGHPARDDGRIGAILASPASKTSLQLIQVSQGKKLLAKPDTIPQPPLGDASCSTDLFQDVIINPIEGSIRAMYSAKLVKLKECEASQKRAILYIAAKKEFQIDAKYHCKVVGGHYAVRCDGNGVKFNESGHFQVTLSGGADFNPQDIKMRAAFE